MGVYVVSMKVKRNQSGDGMYFSGTPTGVNAAGTFRTHRFVSTPAAPVVTLSTGVVDSPLNAGQINGVVAQPVSFVSLLSTGGIADGTTDNMTAIAAAMSQASLLSHKTVLVPAGDFAYNGNLTISGITVAGIGPTSILRAQDPAHRGIFLVGSSAQLKSVYLLNSATSVAANASVDFAGVVCKGSAFLVHNVYIDDVAGPGIDIANSADGVVLQNTLSGCRANAIIAHGAAHDLLVKLNYVTKATGVVGIVAATADAGRVINTEWSYNWIKDNSGTAGSLVMLGAQHANYHNNLMQSNSAHAGLVIAQDGAIGPFSNLSSTAAYNTIENCGKSANGTAALLVYNTSATSGSLDIVRNDIGQANGEPGIRAFGPHSDTLLDNNKISGAATTYVDAITAGVVINLFAGGNAGYPFTVPGSVESPHNSTIPPLTDIVDSRDANWTLDANRTALRNGVATISNAIDLLLYWNRRVYQNTVNGWWVWDDNITSGNQWVVTTDPRIIQSSPPTFPNLSRHPNDFLQIGNPAFATYFVDDNRWGSTGITEGTGQPSGQTPADGFPRRIIATYYEAYNSFNPAYVRLTSVDTRYNVIFMFNVRFNADGTTFFPWLSPSEVTAAQIQTCRNRGQRVILTCGGAGNGFQFNTRTLSNNFISSIQDIITAMGGVDGVDFNNYEQIPPSQTVINEFIFIAQQLKSIYGPNFAITTPPEPTDNTQYMSLVRQLDAAGVLTWVSPQFYDRSDVKTTNVIFNFMNRWISAVAQASQCVMGLGAGNYNTGAATTLTESNREFDRVLSAHPTLRGVFSWNADFDADQSFAFAANFHQRFSAADAGGTGTIAGFTQTVERSLTVGAQGEVAFKTQWSWPFSVNGVTVDGGPFSEVKGFPSLIYGARPGYRATGAYPAFEKAVRLPDGVVVTSPPANAPLAVANNWVASGGSVSTVAPSGATTSNLPRQLLISAGALVVTGRFSASATGKAHVVLDVWLQAPANPSQTSGFANSPITHEIMVPLRNFGNYGAHGFRSSQQTNTHDVVIDGVTYHVYAWMPTAGQLQYNFGSINGNYTNEETGSGRTGWKFIVFQHDGTAHPLLADGSFRIDLGKMLNHCRTRVDSRGINWVQGTEHAVAVEIGVEPVVGDGECIIWDYRVV